MILLIYLTYGVPCCTGMFPVSRHVHPNIFKRWKIILSKLKHFVSISTLCNAVQHLPVLHFHVSHFPRPRRQWRTSIARFGARTPGRSTKRRENNLRVTQKFDHAIKGGKTMISLHTFTAQETTWSRIMSEFVQLWCEVTWKNKQLDMSMAHYAPVPHTSSYPDTLGLGGIAN